MNFGFIIYLISLSCLNTRYNTVKGGGIISLIFASVLKEVRWIMLRPPYVWERSYHYALHEAGELCSLIFDFRIVCKTFKTSKISSNNPELWLIGFVFNTTHCIATHVTILQLSCSFCVQTNYLHSNFFVCVYVSHSLWRWFHFPRTVLQDFILYKVYLMSRYNVFYHRCGFYCRTKVSLAWRYSLNSNYCWRKEWLEPVPQTLCDNVACIRNTSFLRYKQ